MVIAEAELAMVAAAARRTVEYFIVVRGRRCGTVTRELTDNLEQPTLCFYRHLNTEVACSS